MSSATKFLPNTESTFLTPNRILRKRYQTGSAINPGLEGLNPSAVTQDATGHERQDGSQGEQEGQGAGTRGGGGQQYVEMNGRHADDRRGREADGRGGVLGTASLAECWSRARTVVQAEGRAGAKALRRARGGV